ncbi:MAG TPA: DUF5694 domain-containing protein [Pyrinomonadaceae bacterium]|nr:DUF5694 domain-containing protein [Pyrinomonadaceae bacterium]
MLESRHFDRKFDWGLTIRKKVPQLSRRFGAHEFESSRVAGDFSFYYAVVRLGVPFDYAGPDRLAAFYQPNIRIHSNVFKLIESPNDRILVIYGAAQLGWLRQDISNNPSLTLRKLADLTGSKAQ